MDDTNKEVRERAKEEYGKLLQKDKNYFGKRCVIQNIEPTEEYLRRRSGTVADILMPTASTFTNKIETDKTLITKQRLTEPNYVIKFSKDKSTWFTV